MQSSEKMKSVKHLFMTYRNGIVADSLRKAGMPYGVIFGLQLPQLREIARSIGDDIDLARELWRDRNVRESRLLALAIFPAPSLSLEEARSMALDVQTREEADLLPFLLLRHTPHIPALLTSLADGSSSAAEDALPAGLRSYLVETLSRFA